MELIKNVEKATPFSVADQVQYESGKVVSLTLAQQPASGMTLFAFDAGEAISTHAAGGEWLLFSKAKLRLRLTAHQTVSQADMRLFCLVVFRMPLKLSRSLKCY